MRAYIKEVIVKQVNRLFHAPDAETVLSWWIANEGRKPVVVVGAGFTRNALVRATGVPVTSEHVPLWADISRRFAEDLRINDASGIDALTLAELHRDGLGDRRFYDLLLDMLKDNDLSPGMAHDALSRFDAEAIVTTNFLDTLLDRDFSRCVPIINDIDVSRRLDKVQQGKPQQIEVLYLHGHRSHPSTWVLSRSQYEEIPSTRPVLLARVRQLLSQHPVLTVGFSLTDPDFHQVYRQLSLDMKTSHPVGLALLGPSSDAEQKSEQDSAQRRHWEKLGMRTARFKDWNDFGEKFASFFGILNKITIKDLKACIPRGRSFASRVEFARSAIEDPDVEKYVEDFQGEECTLWRSCIDLEFEQEERESVESKIQEYYNTISGVRRVRSVNPGQGVGVENLSSVPLQMPSFVTKYFEGRLPKYWRLAWLCDQWLSTRKHTAEGLADWLSYRLAHEDWQQRGASSDDLDVDVAELISVVWRVTEERTLADTGKVRGKVINQMMAAYRLLRKYGHTEAAERVSEDIKALGGVPRESQEDTPHGQARQSMKSAFLAMMNGDYHTASVQYNHAFDFAVKIDDPLLLWLAAYGRKYSYECLGGESSENQSKAKEYARVENTCAQHRIVLSWKDEAERRVNELRRKTIKGLRDAIRDGSYERQVFSADNTPHFVWRTWRDLDERFAPPGLQKRYLHSLFEHGFDDPAGELKIRLRFGIDKTSDWLEDILDSPESSTAEQRVRDQRIVNAWVDTWANSSATKVEIVACVEVLPPVLKILSAEDVDRPRQLLEKAKTLGYRVTANGGWHFIGTEVARAWLRYAYVFRDSSSYSAFRQFYAGVDDEISKGELERRMGFLPWYVWILRRVASPLELVQWLCGQVVPREDPSSTRRSEELQAQGIAEAILNVILNSDRVEGGLPSVAWDAIAVWCEKLIVGRESHSNSNVDWIGDIVSIVAEHRTQNAHQGNAGTDEPWLHIEKVLFKKVEKLWNSVYDKNNVSSVVSIAWSVSCARPNVGFDRCWSVLMGQVWKWLVERWDEVKRFLTGFPTDVRKFVFFVSSVIEWNLDGSRELANERLLDIWNVSSSVPPAVFRILDPSLWTTGTWSKLLGKLRDGLGGAHGKFPASWRIATLDLLHGALHHQKKDLDESLVFVIDCALALVANEDTLVANHAAAVAMSYAEFHAEGDMRRLEVLVQVVETAAGDLRLSVRQIAAYGVVRLQMFARSQFIRDSAAKSLREFTNEDYWFIQSQLKIGAEEVAVETKRQSTLNLQR